MDRKVKADDVVPIDEARSSLLLLASSAELPDFLTFVISWQGYKLCIRTKYHGTEHRALGRRGSRSCTRKAVPLCPTRCCLRPARSPGIGGLQDIVLWSSSRFYSPAPWDSDVGCRVRCVATPFPELCSVIAIEGPRHPETAENPFPKRSLEIRDCAEQDLPTCKKSRETREAQCFLVWNVVKARQSRSTACGRARRIVERKSFRPASFGN